jgi:hypothetical protein
MSLSNSGGSNTDTLLTRPSIDYDDSNQRWWTRPKDKLQALALQFPSPPEAVKEA